MRFPLSRPRDTVPAMLRVGEGVLVPEATQMLGGSSGINFLNRKAEAKARMPVRHFQRGGTILPELADERLRPDTNWLNDPREKEFSPEEELKYQFRDKLGLPPQHFQDGGTVEPPWLNQLPEFQGSYYPPDWMTADQGPKAPYYGYYGGSDENPQHSWSPYPSYSGNNSGNLYFNQPGDNSAGDTYGNTLNNSNEFLDRYFAEHGNGPYTGSLWDNQGDGGGGEYSGGVAANPHGMSDYNPGGGGYSGGSGANWGGMSAYNPGYPYGSTGSGSGVPTQNFFGLLGSLIGAGAGSLIPGGSLIGSKLGGMGAKALTRMFQNQGANRSMVGGGQGGGGGGGGSGMPGLPRGYSPFGGLPQGFTEHRNAQGAYGAPNFYGPEGRNMQTGDWQGGSTFVNSGTTGDPFVGGAFWSPPGGSIGGPLGTGSAGFEGTGHWDLLGNESMNRLMHGGDTSLGFAGMQNMNAGGNSVILPPSLWGGVGYGGNTGGGSNVSGGTITQRFKSKD